MKIVTFIKNRKKQIKKLKNRCNNNNFDKIFIKD